MPQILLPKSRVELIDQPLFFLAGPIRGASDWHFEAMDHLIALHPDITIASPRRTLREDLVQYQVTSADSFHRQRAWERHYLELAAHGPQRGAILFWLPGEHEHRCEKVYGAMTRLELGQWFTNYRHDRSTRFVVGSDGRFPELDTIAFDLSLDAPQKRIFSSLEGTCAAAMALAKGM